LLPPDPTSEALRPRITIEPVDPGPVSEMVRPGVKSARSRTSSIRWRANWSAPIAEMLIGVSISVVLRRVPVTMIVLSSSTAAAVGAGASCASAGKASGMLVNTVADSSPIFIFARYDICFPFDVVLPSVR
jgi:hypothetical protein